MFVDPNHSQQRDQVVAYEKHRVQIVESGRNLATKVPVDLERHRIGDGHQLVQPEGCCFLVVGLDVGAAT